MTLHMTNLLYCVENVLYFILDIDCLSEKLWSPVVTVRFILIILRGKLGKWVNFTHRTKL